MSAINNASISIQDTVDQKFLTRTNVVVVPEERLAPQENFSTRKRALSSDETSQPPTKRLNKVLPSEKPTVINCKSDVIPAVSRGLATVEACNQATLQKPRDVRANCSPGQNGQGRCSSTLRKRVLSSGETSQPPTKRRKNCVSCQDDQRKHLSCLEKRVRKRKTRRGKKKTKKPLTKVSKDGAIDDQQQLTKSVNVRGKHNQTNAGTVGKCGIHSSTHGQKNNSTEIDKHVGNSDTSCTVRDAGVVPQADHCNTSAVTAHPNVAFAEGNASMDSTAHEAHTANATEEGNCHPSDANERKSDASSAEDLFVLIIKANGVAYAVCKGNDRILGQGGFGIVYKGFKLEGTSKLPVAIKVVKKASIACFVEDDEIGFVPEEVAMLNKIRGHPNAIQLIDYVSIADFVAIIMERPVNCKDLFDIIAQQTSAMSEVQARNMMNQLSSVLLAMEKKGMVHRDIKSENILVDLDNGQMKLIDFGLATTCVPGKPIKKFCGTRENTPPEYILNGEYEGPKESVWTLGLLLYYLVCGDEPFRNFLETTTKPLRIPSYLSSDLKDLLLGMLRKNASGRMTMEQVCNHPWMTTQTNSFCLPFGC